MTSYQRRCDVMTSHRRRSDVILTSCACWVKTVSCMNEPLLDCINDGTYYEVFLLSTNSLLQSYIRTYCVKPHILTYEPPHGKPTICICENKDADQLRGNRKADQHLCFHYTDSTIPLLLKTEAFFCVCIAQFVSDLYGNHNIGFPTRWLIF